MHARVAVLALLFTACAAPTGYTTHRATEHVYWAGNIPEYRPTSLPWDPANASGTSNGATVVEVYDALGTPHELAVYFVCRTTGVWDLHAVTDAAELAGGAWGPRELVSGTIVCNAGLASLVTPTRIDVTFAGAPPQSIEFSLDAPAGAHDWPGATCSSGPSSVSAFEQDGF